jgi:hypothetical protein
MIRRTRWRTVPQRPACRDSAAPLDRPSEREEEQKPADPEHARDPPDPQGVAQIEDKDPDQRQEVQIQDANPKQGRCGIEKPMPEVATHQPGKDHLAGTHRQEIVRRVVQNAETQDDKKATSESGGENNRRPARHAVHS